MVQIFDQITDKEKAKLLKIVESNTLIFKPNTSVSSVIKSDNMIGIIIKGYIQIAKNDYKGNRIIIEELEENEIFGTMISSLKGNDYDVITKEETEIIFIDYDRIIHCEQSNKEYYQQFIKNLLAIIMSKTQEKNERIEILTQKTIRNKLLEYFNIMAKKKGSKYIYLPFNFIDLADYLAVDRSAMSRELKYLKEEGFIEIKGKKITLCYDKDSSIYLY